MPATPASLQDFVDFCEQYIQGNERKDAQTFLDRFFRAFGHKGALEAGASYEEPVKKGSKTGNTGFADLVWKSKVLIEMKKRGEDLNKHYSQAFQYWTRLVPNRPRYVLLCNFDEFWIFDFDTQVDTPVDTIPLENLPKCASAFRFMEGSEKPLFGNNQVELTQRNARRLGELFIELKKNAKRRGFNDLAAQRFILQCVLAMFAEDRGLLPADLFSSCIQDCLAGANSYDVLGNLFREMNQPGITPTGRYKGVDYFNGGLFSVIHPIELTPEELKVLDACAREDWGKIRPAIFGSIFEGTVDAENRHSHGIHFTSEADIMKIVRPTISRYWEERIEAASTIGELNALQIELQGYRVLDPACGSGNFLYIAYQEIKRIEQLLLEKIAAHRRYPCQQIEMSSVTPLQFYGMDNNPFAVELARVTLMIARKVAIDKLGLNEPTLPLDSLDNNIVCTDALFSQWPAAHAIIGNPPFLGGHRIRKELGNETTDRIFNKFSEIKNKQIDIATYWFRLAHNHMGENGRAGFVATNSISQGKSREASLDYITQNNGYIYEAVSSQPWSGKAKVHVSIINWCKKEPNEFYLDSSLVKSINSSLQPSIEVSKATKIKANRGYCIRGVEPNGHGFKVPEPLVKEWIKSAPENQQVLKLFSMGDNLAQNPHGTPEELIIDFRSMEIEEASSYTLPFNHVEKFVKPERLNNSELVLQQKWWLFRRTNEAVRLKIALLRCYFTVPRVSKWAVFIPAPLNWLPGEKALVVTSDDFYVFGILTSKVHRAWMHAQKSTLKADIAYTPTTCFETFPFPQNPSRKLIEQIRETAQQLHRYRTQQMEAKKWGITQLYNKFFDEPASQLAKLHAQLDQLVMQAYEFESGNDILEKLLELNQQLAEKENQHEPIVGPWAP